MPKDIEDDDLEQLEDLAYKLLDLLEQHCITIPLTPALRSNVVWGVRDISTVLR